MLVDLPSEPLKDVSGTAHFQYPATWFDYLRKTYFPNFLSEKFPIKYKDEYRTVKIEVGVVYPRFAKAFPKESKDMRFYSYQKI